MYALQLSMGRFLHLAPECCFRGLLAIFGDVGGMIFSTGDEAFMAFFIPV